MKPSWQYVYRLSELTHLRDNIGFQIEIFICILKIIPISVFMVYKGRDTAATAREESALACPYSRRELTPLGRLQKYPKMHVSPGEESSGSGPDSTQGLRPWHRRERNSDRTSSNSHGDWPFLRLPERVHEVPVVSREHLPQLGKIQEVLPCRRDEALFP